MSKRTDLTKALRDIETKSVINVNIGDSNIDVTVRHTLPADERLSFVQNVADGVIHDGKRCFALYDIVFAKNILLSFTDLKFAMTEKNFSILLSCTELLKEVFNVIGKDLIDSLNSACRDQIAAAQSAEIAIAAALVRPDPLDRIADIIESYFDRVGTSIGDVDMNGLNNLISLVKEQDVSKIIADKMSEVAKEGSDGKEDSAKQTDKP